MTLSLLMDHHVPSAITSGLRRLGVDTKTALEAQAARLPDDLLLDRAATLGRVLFTQDDDLLAVARRLLDGRRSFPGVIYAHPLRITIGQAVRDLHLMAEILNPEEMRDRVVFLPL